MPVVKPAVGTTKERQRLAYSSNIEPDPFSEPEEQMAALAREHKGEGEHLSVHHPDNDPAARDDAPDACALSLFGPLVIR